MLAFKIVIIINTIGIFRRHDLTTNNTMLAKKFMVNCGKSKMKKKITKGIRRGF